MNLLRAGVNITVIALWLGHEDPAIARTTPPGTPAGRYQPPDQLLAFLSQL